MNRTMLRKIWNDVLHRKGRTLLVSTSIFIGVLGVIALFSTRDLISQQLADDIQQDELAMIEIVVSVEQQAALDNATILATLNRENEIGQAFPALAGIERVEGQAFYGISYKKPGADEYEDGELRAYSVPLQEVQIEPMRLYDGEWALAGQNEVMVEKRFADKHGYSVGDEIVFASLQNDVRVDVTYTISGIVFHPYSFRGIDASMPGPAVGIYAPLEVVEQVLGVTSYNRIVARYETFDQAVAQYEGFQTALMENSPYLVVFPTFEDPALNNQVEAAAVYTSILTALALVTMIVSGFLVINVINTIVAEQKKQIGAMKAIGANTRETFLLYAGMAFTYGLIGTMVAVIPGILVGWIMTRSLAVQLDVLIEDFRWSPSSVFLGIILGLLVPILSAGLPVLNGVRVKIVEAFTDLGISATYGEGAFSQLIGRLPLPISLKQGLSNVYQKRGRLMLTGLTLTLTVGTFMATMALGISLSNELSRLFDRLGYQLLVQPNAVQDRAYMEEVLMDVDGVERLAPAGIFWIQVEGDFVNFFTGNNQLQIYGVDPRSDSLKFDLVEGEGWTNDPTREGIIISSSLAKQLGLKPGDQMAFNIAGKRVTREVLAIDSNAFDSANMAWDDMAALAGFVTGAPRPNEYMLAGSLADYEDEISAIGLDEGLMALVSPAYDSANPGVVISGALAESANLEEGDTLMVTLEGQMAERKVIAIVPNALLEANARQTMPTLAGNIPEDVVLFGFNDLVSVTGVSTEGTPVPNGYYVTVEQDNATADDADDVLKNIKTRLMEEGIASTYINQVAVSDTLAAQVDTNLFIIYLAAMLIAAVGAIGLLTTLSIAVLERQKEIGVMRSIGATSSTIATQFVFEGLLVGFVAWIVGIPLSYFLARGLFAMFKLENVPFTYPPEGLLFGLVGILGIAALASMGPSMAAARKTVSDILRYQ